MHGVKLQALGLVHGAQDVLCSRNTADRQPGQAGGDSGGEKSVCCPGFLAWVQLCRKGNLSLEKKGRQGDSKQVRGMRSPLQGLSARQSPVQSSRLPPATHCLHTRGQRPRGGQGLAQAHAVAELGLKSPFFLLEVEQKERGAGGRQPSSSRWCGRPGQ